MTVAGLNILLITCDQWRGDMLGAAGHPLAHTPNLDRLTRQGTRFARHYTQAYPCAPARAGLATGLYAHKHRVVQNGTPLDARHPTLFQEARRAGYRPRLFGYTDTMLDPRGRPDQDPDRTDYENVCPGILVDTLLTESALPWLAHLMTRGHKIDPEGGREAVFRQSRLGEPAVFEAADSETAFLTDRFLAWLSVSGAKPWFAHLSYVIPHPPFGAPAPFHAAVDPADVPLPRRGRSPADEAAQHPLIAPLYRTMPAEKFVPGLEGLARDVDDAAIRQIKAVYAGMIQHADDQIGRVLDALAVQGLTGRTLIVFTADHGEQMFDHWMLGKTGYFDASAHIPLILRDPRSAADAGRGGVVERFTETIDVMPTILEAAGLTAPRNCDGRSLLPFCAGITPPQWRDEVHWSFDFRDLATKELERALGLPSDWCNLQVVRTERFKYVHFAALPPVLFDLAEDPDELVNRAEDPACRSLRSEAQERLLTWRQRHEERTLTGYLGRDGSWIEETVYDPYGVPS
jgi:arylsulfatase A-like enzyme